MGKASSAKKVARAARAGGSAPARAAPRASASRCSSPASCCSASLLVVFAREQPGGRRRAPLPGERARIRPLARRLRRLRLRPSSSSTDEGTCFIDAAGDPHGIHTHGDGVIHIHPFTDAAGGATPA